MAVMAPACWDRNAFSAKEHVLQHRWVSLQQGGWMPSGVASAHPRAIRATRPWSCSALVMSLQASSGTTWTKSAAAPTTSVGQTPNPRQAHHGIHRTVMKDAGKGAAKVLGGQPAEDVGDLRRLRLRHAERECVCVCVKGRRWPAGRGRLHGVSERRCSRL
jgi:hypothetical protein